MEIGEAVQRIFRLHSRLLILFVAAGVAASLAAGVYLGHHHTTYTATTRLVLDTSDSKSLAEATAIADTARALATSPGHVRAALSKAGAERDVTAYARDDVRVQVMGTSGVVALSVTDRDPAIAAAVANLLADDVIQTRLAITSSPTVDLVRDIDNQIQLRDKQIENIDAQRGNPGNSPETQSALAAIRASLLADRSALFTKRNDLLSAEGLRLKPRILDAAQPPTKPDLLLLYPDLGLGALVGLLVGVGLIAALETIRPTLVGRDALARQAKAPVLAELLSSPEVISAEDMALLQASMERAAESVNATTIELLSARPDVDLSALAAALTESGRNGSGGSDGSPPPALLVRVWEPAYTVWSTAVPEQSAAVLVTPSIIRGSEFARALELISATRWPLLGLVAYRPVRGQGSKVRQSVNGGRAVSARRSARRPAAAARRREW